MFKFLALISIIALCTADDYYQMSIDHDGPKIENKAATEPESPTSDLKVESSGYDQEYKKDEIDRSVYYIPSNYGYMEKKDDYESGTSYSAPYGYERPTYQKQSYERPSYGQSQSYDPEPYIEKSYSSPVSAMRHVEIKPVQSSGYEGQKDHTIDVKDDTPIVIHFRTHANQIRVEQTRIPDKPRKVEHTRSEDEPHRVIHEVYKPVIQEVREIIQPFRKVVQQVQPVVEEVQTVVHKAEGRRARGGGSDEGEYGQRQYNNKGYAKRSSGRRESPNRKYNTIRDYLPQGSVHSYKGIPVYRSQYNRPVVSQKKQ